MSEAPTAPDIHGGTCSQEGCSAAEGGACAQGHEDKIDCEFYELVTLEGAPQAEVTVPTISLPDGEALRSDELERVLGRHPAAIVVPLGRVGAGKTTLITLAYLLLRSRRLSGWAFTGSETLIGLARRAHDASFASEREVPVTPRTGKPESGQYIHLGIRATASDATHPVLVADISGEHVEAFVDGELPESIIKTIRRADHIPLVVDGRQLADPKTRALAVFQARALLLALKKQLPPGDGRLLVVVTKGDLLATLADLDNVIASITNGTIAEGAPHFVTADRASTERDSDSQPLVTLGQGIEEFVTYIANRREIRASGTTASRMPQPWPSPILQRMWSSR